MAILTGEEVERLRRHLDDDNEEGAVSAERMTDPEFLDLLGEYVCDQDPDTLRRLLDVFYVGRTAADRLAEVEARLAEIHGLIGRGEGHGSVDATADCVVSGIIDLKADRDEVIAENKRLEAELADVQETRHAERIAAAGIVAELREVRAERDELKRRLEAATELIAAIDEHSQLDRDDDLAAWTKAASREERARAAFRAISAPTGGGEREETHG